ncbi:hypothetical protein [Sabulicella rubraurantiaca]|uniref:hypothetical protein n=1 Tax=Sabulicella rubraurantiaca TaxID=2811429 RepID=UPI001A9592D6|nr:hypothetical protein [Sabulicella rubraurantiaca]
MIRIGALAAILAVPLALAMPAGEALAQSAPVRTASVNCVQNNLMEVVSVTFSTSRVPRMGPGSDLKTADVRIRNRTPSSTYRVTGTLSRPGVEQSFMNEVNLTLGPGATTRFAAANVVRIMTEQDIRNALVLTCS